MTQRAGAMRLLVRVVVTAVGVGAALGALTKAVLELFRRVIDLLWVWLPDQLGVEPTNVAFTAAVLAIGGVLVGLGQRYLGYHPKPLEEVVEDVRRGDGIDHRTIPRTLANSIAALGFGGPLGPEAALVAVLGGVFYWTKQNLEQLAMAAYQVLRGAPAPDDDTRWRYAPAVVAGITLVMVFRALPGGVDLTFVPRPADPATPDLLIPALVAGLVGGGIGVLTDRVEAMARARRLFDRAPVPVALAGGLAVAALATPSHLVLFSGTDSMPALFDGSTSDATIAYAAGAKWVALMLVFATGWKGGPVFPLMFIAGASAVAGGHALGIEPVALYAGGIAGAATGVLGSLAFGALAALLVVPPGLFVLVLAGAAGAGLVLFVRHHTSAPGPAA
jgi:H+/Cl- antiporter ClcA